MAKLARDFQNNIVPVVGFGAVQSVVIGATSTQSPPIDNTVIRMVSDVGCYIKIGASPVADNASTFLPAGAIEYIRITKGNRVAVIQQAAGGVLNITECD